MGFDLNKGSQVRRRDVTVAASKQLTLILWAWIPYIFRCILGHHVREIRSPQVREVGRYIDVSKYCMYVPLGSTTHISPPWICNSYRIVTARTCAPDKHEAAARSDGLAAKS